MKSYELQPTSENILLTIEDDLIDRNEVSFRFFDLLDSLEGSYTIAIDGKWGSGKTFFVKQLKMIINAYNTNGKEGDSEVHTRLKNSMGKYKRRGQELREFKSQIAVYYDSWANDNDVDPILSIIYEIIQSVNSDFMFTKGTDLFHVAGTIAEFFTGKNVNSLIDLAKVEDPFEKLKEQRDIHGLFSKFLESLLTENGTRLVVFVDELDRCKPSYAVQLLERVKHYFLIDSVTFVFSVNLNELQHTIKHYYGNGIDASRYLDRFFDLRSSLPPPNINNYYKKIGLSEGNYFEVVCKEVIKKNRFELREMAKFYRLARAAAYNPTHKNNHYFSFADNDAVRFCLVCVVPVMIGMKICNYERYNAFIQGKDSSPLVDVLSSGIIARNFLSSLLDQKETYDDPKQEGDVKVKRIDKIDKTYKALFLQDYSQGTTYVTVGDLSFSQETRDEIMRVESLLSDYAEYSN